MSSEIKGSPILTGESAIIFNKRADENENKSEKTDFSKECEICEKIIRKSELNSNSWLSNKWENLPKIEPYVDYKCYLDTNYVDDDSEIMTVFVWTMDENREILPIYLSNVRYDPKIGNEDLINDLIEHFKIY